METAVGIPFIKNKSVFGFNFDLLPRRGVHLPADVTSAKNHIRENYHKVGEITVTWLPQLPGPPPDHNKYPHFIFRTQWITGGLAPKKRAIWASMDFGNYSLKMGLYDGSPHTSNLLPQAQIIFSSGKHQYTFTGEELAFLLQSDKTIQKKKLK